MFFQSTNIKSLNSEIYALKDFKGEVVHLWQPSGYFWILPKLHPSVAPLDPHDPVGKPGRYCLKRLCLIPIFLRLGRLGLLGLNPALGSTYPPHLLLTVWGPTWTFLAAFEEIGSSGTSMAWKITPLLCLLVCVAAGGAAQPRTQLLNVCMNARYHKEKPGPEDKLHEQVGRGVLWDGEELPQGTSTPILGGGREVPWTALSSVCNDSFTHTVCPV